jgi:hypothetical protein
VDRRESARMGRVRSMGGGEEVGLGLIAMGFLALWVSERGYGLRC